MWANLAAAQGDENARKLRDGLAGRNEFRTDCRRAASRTRVAGCPPDSEPLKRAAVALGAPSVSAEPPREFDAAGIKR